MALSPATTAKLNEWLQWYNWHHDKIEAQPLETQVKWLLKAQQGAYEAFSMIASELNGSNARSTRIIVPSARW